MSPNSSFVTTRHQMSPSVTTVEFSPLESAPEDILGTAQMDVGADSIDHDRISRCAIYRDAVIAAQQTIIRRQQHMLNREQSNVADTCELF